MRVRKHLATMALLLPAPTLAADWQPLVTADTFAQWTIEGQSQAIFQLEGDTLTGKPNPEDHAHNSFLCSPGQYQDFELKFAFRISHPELNSGVQFRSEAQPEGVAGPQFELDVAQSSDYGMLRRIGEPIYNFFTGRIAFDYSSAGIYGELLDTGWIYPGIAGGDPQAFAEQGARLTNVQGWNEVRLRAIGSRIETWMAQELRAEFDYAPADKPGVICLQVHGGGYDKPQALSVEWRNLMIRPLSAESSP